MAGRVTRRKVQHNNVHPRQWSAKMWPSEISHAPPVRAAQRYMRYFILAVSDDVFTAFFARLPAVYGRSAPSIGVLFLLAHNSGACDDVKEEAL